MKEWNGLFIVKKLLSFYLLFGSIYYLCTMLYSFGVLGYLSYFLPLTFFMILFLFFIYSGYKGVMAKAEDSFILAQWSFFIQSFQIKILGLHFDNFFGPYFGIGFSDEPKIHFISSIKLFSYHFLNGYDKNSTEISIVINLISIGFGILLGLKEKRPEPEILQ